VSYFRTGSVPLPLEQRGQAVLAGEEGLPAPILPRSPYRTVDEWMQQSEHALRP
jgi:hypothetical protein